jgi:hypothetical protein
MLFYRFLEGKKVIGIVSIGDLVKSIMDWALVPREQR